jgi:hypothetical protein
LRSSASTPFSSSRMQMAERKSRLAGRPPEPVPQEID